MFVYTFENINKIKDLNHSDSMKPKHKKKIDRIKDGLFAKFNYSEFKEKAPPKNESLQTYNELLSLQKLPQDIEFVKEKDRITEVFKKVCKRYGVEFPEEKVETLLKDSAGVIMDLKYHFNRPRPGKLAQEYNIKLAEVILSSMKTPSYPSGHSTQGYLIGLYLAEKFDDDKMAMEFLAEAKAISKARNIGRAHYPSDSKIGEELGKKMFRYIKKDIEQKL
tara:strand:+ start:1462 stop:2124 length:663 start_codon:yes stop_codon:yes gene_type:complete